MGGSPQTKAAEESQQTNMANAARSYQLGFQGLREQHAGIDAALAGGESPALTAAFGGARAGMLDSATIASGDAMKRGRQQEAGAVQGGNVGASLANPSDMGATLARAMYGSRLSEAAGNIEETNKLLGMNLGVAQTAGSGSLTAEGNALKQIPLMQNYNSTYANLMGALNLGTSLYGAGSQAGWFTGNPSGAAGYGNPFTGAGSTASVGFEGT